MQKADLRVRKFILNNGLTVLICPKKKSSKVSLQLWYNVGSKHEVAGEKGMAHFIEHMIFKGTDTLLTESDINMITQKLSAYANAFTSYDYTGYLFDIPVANWDKVLPVFADCMQNCTFDQEHMNSEVKAVIQELKMYRDDFTWTLADSLVTAIFESHPYHFPIIGYKQDLWNLKRQTLIDFYKRWYIPQNATLVIVGDLDVDQALIKIKKEFESIPRGVEIKRPDFFITEDIQSKSITIYRELEQSVCMLAFVLPGVNEKKEFLYDIIANLLSNGKSSRLQKILIDEKELALSVNSLVYDLFDREIFFIEFKPKNEKDIEVIKQIIFHEISDIVENGLSEQELSRALRFAQVDHEHMLEDTHKQAYAIGKSFVATGDEQYPFNYCTYEFKKLNQDIIELFKHYFRASICHEGKIINAQQSEHKYLSAMQEESDALDTKILFGKERTSSVACASYVHDIAIEKLINISSPKVETITLSNGLVVLLEQNNQVNLVEVFLHYQANYYYDPILHQGTSYLASQMMLEGTKDYPGNTFMNEVESLGISLYSTPGQILATMLSQDLIKGLNFIVSMVARANFEEKDFKKIKNKTKLNLKEFWDTPKKFVTQLAAEKLYLNHPYGKMVLGTEESLDKIDRQFCFDFYKNYISPQGSTISIVGNFDLQLMKEQLEKIFESWQGKQIEEIKLPALFPVQKETINVEKNRDQIVLAFAGLSVERMSPDYDCLSIFDQILTNGMSSKLFELREQSGLFYTIGGSLVRGAGKAPGMIFIRTIVSKDRLDEAQKAIEYCFDNAIDTVTQVEFDEAKEVVVNGFAELFETNGSTASTLIFLQKYNLPFNYFENKIPVIRKISLHQMKEVVKEYLNSKKMLCLRIGRI